MAERGGEKKVVLKCGTVDDIRSAAWLKQEQIRYDTFREDQFLKKKEKKKRLKDSIFAGKCCGDIKRL